jgi:hypothetical protein
MANMMQDGATGMLQEIIDFMLEQTGMTRASPEATAQSRGGTPSRDAMNAHWSTDSAMADDCDA